MTDAAPVTQEHLALPDGRRLDVRVSGPDGGTPLVFHHGTPGACTPLPAMERGAHARGLRLLTTSRPGYGDSTRHPGRRVVDVVADTAAALRWAGAGRCVVAGWSGGGPHALACAARLPEVAAALVIAGVAPYGAADLDWLAGMGEENVVEFGMAAGGEERLRPYLEAQGVSLASASIDELVTTLATVLPGVDRAVVTDEYGTYLAASFHEALRTGVDGWLDDDLAFLEPWGFGLGEIDVPLSLWQGSDDLMVPFGHGQWLAAQLPGADAHLEDGHGHLSIGVGEIERILDELVAAGGV